VPEWVELANGCLCCSVKAEFVQALEGLLAADSSYSGKFDYILVETTGGKLQPPATQYVITGMLQAAV
jgi:G3E family GTPase